MTDVNFEHIYRKHEPSKEELSKFLVYIDKLMWDGDEIEMTRLMDLLTEDTNFLAMIAMLRGTYAYKRNHDFPAWTSTLHKVRDWMLKRDKNPYSLLHGLL